MKITIFGLTLSSSWGNGHATPYRSVLRALHRRGAQIVFYEKDVPYYAMHRDFTSCQYCKLVLYDDWNSIRHQALLDARESDVVITASYCPEGARISDEVPEVSGALRVFYDLDTPTTLSCLATGELDYLRREQIAEFDLYLSFTGGKILQRLEREWGAQRARALYGCVDPDLYHRVPPKREFDSELSYMGTYASDRQPKLEELFLEPARRRHAGTFLLAGSLYPPDWRWPHNVRRFEHIAPHEHPALYSSSRATLNITRRVMAESGYCPSGRFFEAAACATPIFTDNWEGLDFFFDVENDLRRVSSADEVIASLRLPDSELLRMGQRARLRTLDEHTGTRRADELIAYCEEASRQKYCSLEVAS